MKPLSTALLCVFLIALWGCGPNFVQISNFRHGLIEFDASGQPRIYEEGHFFPYKVNGTCTAAGKQVPCLWRGIEFSYESPDEVTTFDCVSTSNQPRTCVNPREVTATDTKTCEWKFSVPGRRGRYIGPGYTFDIGPKALHTTTVCTNKGREVLRWQVGLTPIEAFGESGPRSPSPRPDTARPK